jgi:ParB family transcriptional regulator, chromosome partitioning protein
MSKSSLRDTLALLADASNVRVQGAADSAVDERLGKYCFVSTDALMPGKFQPRKHFDQESLQDLANSIGTDGVLQPLIIRAISHDRYEIIAGERRWRASKLAGLETIPAIVRDVSDEGALAFGILENLQRENLNPIEEAEAYKRLINEFSLTHEDVSLRLGKSRAVITNGLRLLKLPPLIQHSLMEGNIQAGHARVLLSAPEESIIDIFNMLVANKMSVRELESYVRKVGAGGMVQSSKPMFRTINKTEAKISELACQLFERQCEVKLSKNGFIKIPFDSVDSSEIIEKLNELLALAKA